jgi:hypothetical protein
MRLHVHHFVLTIILLHYLSHYAYWHEVLCYHTVVKLCSSFASNSQSLTSFDFLRRWNNDLLRVLATIHVYRLSVYNLFIQGYKLWSCVQVCKFLWGHKVIYMGIMLVHMQVSTLSVSTYICPDIRCANGSIYWCSIFFRFQFVLLSWPFIFCSRSSLITFNIAPYTLTVRGEL